MTVLTFTHANLKRPVKVMANAVGYWFWNNAEKCVVLFTSAGPIPVAETVEQIETVLTNCNNNKGEQEHE